ncbi:maleylpyruvate isomerase family mycothiol-dependent enzyme [Mycobacterium sp.]|uniref:maleylpyruvate isomerase family mycothiol-dependent enzyme n=1 Tax=Mycobacterium sp. TaxID=1785 RepID=UPI0025E6222E|nr:maleylpyruvate isomerase family mycothiol-dependent enzyme [Mycobacterium sp.]MBW0012267.1 maleylpyruvate isomerase family mycothiol-dependent enzyme [Mycobacterium sp.]
MTARQDVEAERSALADSLATVGPRAPTACGDWTAFDLAAHVVAADRAAGVPAFCIRTLAARGVQFSPRPEFARWVIRRQRRVGYHALIAHLREPSPRLLLAPKMAALSLFEVWTHHDDLATANGLAHAVPEHLVEAIPWLVRYQIRRLPKARLVLRTTENHELEFGPATDPAALVSAPTADLVRWLAGRNPHNIVNIQAETALAAQIHAFAGRI